MLAQEGPLGPGGAANVAASLYRLACECSYREADEKISASDGEDWYWRIHEKYFADAVGILDWYHASEHVWGSGKRRSALNSPLGYFRSRVGITDYPTYRARNWQIGTGMIESTAK